MRLRHFETLRPVCPVCRDVPSGSTHALRVSAVDRGGPDDVVEGTLGCPNPACLREYPVIDGVPLIVPAIREYVAQQGHALWARDDLGPAVESLLGDCAGQGSAADAFRQQLGTYAWDHYAEFDPAEPGTDPRPGGVARLLRRGLEGLGTLPAGPVLDAGCSVGRTAFDLAARTGELVLGVDLNFAMLRLAQAVARGGPVRYPRRQVGLVYERREFAVPFVDRGLVDFWACDAAALPLPDSTFAAAVSLNLLDAIPDPYGHLRGLARVLAPGGRALVCSPYDWSASATAVEGWLGGHSQRGPGGGASEPVVRALLTPGAHPASLGDLVLTGELDGLPWNVRLHDRATMNYRVHMVFAAKRDAVGRHTICS